MGYASLTVNLALATAAYGATAFIVGRNNEKSPAMFMPIAWIALFIFMNVQISHYYSWGKFVDFSPKGNLAHTVAYTLAWGIYGMMTLFARIGKKGRMGMVAGICLISIALAKLFLSDIWLLSAVYRIVVFIGMAVILIAGSFLYQARAAK
jgi:uncharacterized membrane protein